MFHSPAKEELGNKLKTAWEATDARKIVAGARETYAGAFTRGHVALQGEEARIDALLVTHAAVNYDGTVEDELKFLQQRAGVSHDTFPCASEKPVDPAKPAEPGKSCKLDAAWKRGFDTAVAMRDSRQRIWEGASERVKRAIGIPLPTCAVWLKDEDGLQKKWAERAEKTATVNTEIGKPEEGLTQRCKALEEAKAALAQQWERFGSSKAAGVLVAVGIGGPSISSQIIAVGNLRNEIETMESAAKAEAEALKKAAAAAAEAEEKAKKDKDNKPLADTAKERALTAQKRIKTILKAAEAWPGNPFLQDLASEVKRQSITDFLRAVGEAKEGEVPAASSSKAGHVVVVLANYFDDTNKKLEVAKGYTMAAVVMEEQIAEAQKAAAKRRVDILRQRLAVEEQILRAMQTSAAALVQAQSDMEAFTVTYPGARLHESLLGPDSDGSKKIKAQVGPEHRAMLWRGLGRYVHTIKSSTPALSRLQLQRQALRYAEQLDQSEANVRIWDILISSSVDQLAEWAKYGVTEVETQQAISNLIAGLIALRLYQ